MNWLRKIFSAGVPHCDAQRYAETERELAEVKGNFHNTVQSAKSGSARLRLMEDTLALKETFDGSSGR